jgi:alpha-amylase/alpha-mannosidase (GH57 family)
MHQPYYRQGLTGEYRLPWVYLHGIKDYSDMAAHLESHPEMRAVVNFVPVLLEQIDDYAQQITRFLDTGSAMQDGLLNLLAGIAPIPSDEAARLQLIRDCQRCHAPRMIHPYPAFSALLQLVGATDDMGMGCTSAGCAVRYLNDQYFLDLLTWYHLAWLGQSLRKSDEVQALFAHSGSFSAAQRRSLLTVMRDCLAGLIPRYRALSERGQVELAMTPYGHPIIPLLHSFENMQCATPEAPRPQALAYPDGDARSAWHVTHGLSVFAHYFGHQPKGVWLAEGGISEDAVALLDAHGIAWTASGEGVWRNSCHLSGCEGLDSDSKRGLFKPRQHNELQTRLFFRDDGLSDLIGFRYSDWHADDAARDFVQHLTNIANFLGDEADQHVVSVILDGENAWEYYPDNGQHFLDALYEALSTAARVRTTTFADVAKAVPALPLPQICAGSWVYGSFSTWIGSPDKNRGWDYLVAAKTMYDKVVAKGKLSAAKLADATQQLAVCEGSDWFWWFGDYNPAGSVSDFEQLYREQLRELYKLLGVAAPAMLDIPLSQGGGNAENAGTMRRNVE